jgi:transcriptional regulator with XRE-family HTH domain
MQRARLENGITLKQLAEQIELSESYMSLIESGARRPSVAVAKRIAAVLGFEWTRFFEDEEGEGRGA